MKEVIAIELNKLRNAEYVQILKDLFVILQDGNVTNLKIVDEFNKLLGYANDIGVVFKTDQGSDLTPAIENEDARRDKAVIGIAKHIDSYTLHFEDKKVAAATLLAEKLKIYGTASDIARLALPAETATIDNLVEDFNTQPSLVAAVKELGLAAWLNELKTANDNLALLYIQRTKQLGDENPNNIKDIRLKANDAYQNLRDMFVAQGLVAKWPANYVTVLNRWNALLEQYNTVINNRAALAEKRRNNNKGNDNNEAE